MAIFRYSMQSILNIKEKLETQMKQEFAEARIRYDMEQDKLNQLYDRKIKYEEDGVLLLKGTLRVLDIEENKIAINQMEELIKVQMKSVENSKLLEEKARKNLEDAMKEKKTFEVLKEKAFEDFLNEEKQNESKEVDELNSYTYGQKRQVNG